MSGDPFYVLPSQTHDSRRLYLLVALYLLASCRSPQSDIEQPHQLPLREAVLAETVGATKSVVLRESVPFLNDPKHPIYVNFTLTNNSDVSVTLSHSETAADIGMKLTDYWTGLAVPMTDWGKLHGYNFRGQYTLNVPFTLLPHESRAWQYNLRDYFTFPNAGIYSLAATRSIDWINGQRESAGLLSEVNVGPTYFRIIDPDNPTRLKDAK